MMKQIIRRIMYITCLLSLVIYGYGCNSKKEKNTKEEVEKVTKVTVFHAKELEYNPILEYTGTAEAYKTAELGTSIPGRVEKIHYAKGSYVPKDSLIVEMSDELLVQAQVEYDAICKDYDRIARLREKGSISEMDYDHIKAKMDAAASKVKMLHKSTSIIAPFSGVLTDISVEEGENYSYLPSINSNLELQNGVVTLRQLDPLKVMVNINEKDILLVNKGQKANIMFDAIPGETVSGTVTYIAPVLSPTSRSTEVEISIPNKGLHLKAGMSCTVKMTLPKTTGIFIPINAIYRHFGDIDDVVFVVGSDSRVTPIQISRGTILKEMIQIPEIEKGDVIVIDGKGNLKANSLVQITGEVETTTESL